MCGHKQATTFLTLMVNDKVKKMHLCEACAAASGLDGAQPISISEVLLGLGGKKPPAETVRKVCPRCHMHFTDFKKTSRLGCQSCYDAFAEELAPLLESIQKGSQHVGKKPVHSPPAPPPPPADRIAALQEALAAAVKSENYEEAARIRDRIREGSGKTASAPPKKSP